jgi:hypothetical protein
MTETASCKPLTLKSEDDDQSVVTARVSNVTDATNFKVRQSSIVSYQL